MFELKLSMIERRLSKALTIAAWPLANNWYAAFSLVVAEPGWKQFAFIISLNIAYESIQLGDVANLTFPANRSLTQVFGIVMNWKALIRLFMTPEGLPFIAHGIFPAAEILLQSVSTSANVFGGVRPRSEN